MILIRHSNENDFLPFFAFALEEYILTKLVKENEVCFFTYQIKGVIIGQNQLIENEVNIKYLKENDINLFRRATGGGAVYADEQNLMYSMITKRKDDRFVFKPYFTPFINAFSKLGIPLEFSGRNDLVLNEKKVSGLAFLKNKYGMIMHGTLLYNTDISVMASVITPSKDKLESKGIDSVRARVTNLKPYLNDLTIDQLNTYLENEITTRIYHLSDEDLRQIKIIKQKYMNPSYIHGNQPLHTKNITKRFDWGNITISLTSSKGFIKDLFFSGDFFTNKPLEELRGLLTNHSTDLELLKVTIRKIDVSNYLIGAKNEDIIGLFTKLLLV